MERKIKKSEYMRYWWVKIVARFIELWLVADMIIWILATANWQWIAWINLFLLSGCLLVLAHTNLD